MDDANTNWLLKTHLQTFVPLAMAEYATGQRQLTTPRPDLAQVIAEHGDAVLYRVKGQSGRAVGAVVEALASLAFCPGGVTFLGLHFEAPPDVAQAAWAGGSNQLDGPALLAAMMSGLGGL